jgi:hypothetical protein
VIAFGVSGCELGPAFPLVRRLSFSRSKSLYEALGSDDAVSDGWRGRDHQEVSVHCLA